MAVNKGIGYIGTAKQSALGSAASAATFLFGALSGSIAKVDVQQEADLVTAASRYLAIAYRDRVACGIDIETRAYTGSAGLWLLAALGTDSVAGAGDPYTHTFSTGTMPYLTCFGSMGASDAVRTAVHDVKVSELGLSWDGPGPVTLNASGVGTTIDATQGAFTGGATDERAGTNFFVGAGGTFAVDAVGASPASAYITGGNVKIVNDCEAIFTAGTVTAADVMESRCRVDVELTVVPANLNDWIEVVTGSTTGSTPSSDVQYGSFSIAFAEHGTGTHTLTLSSSKCAFTCEMPDLDGAGGPTELTLVGTCFYNATDADAFKAVLTSATATY